MLPYYRIDVTVLPYIYRPPCRDVTALSIKAIQQGGRRALGVGSRCIFGVPAHWCLPLARCHSGWLDGEVELGLTTSHGLETAVS